MGTGPENGENGSVLHRDATDMLVPLDKRTFGLGVANGALVTAGQRAADPGTVIPLLALKLIGAEWAVGLVAVVMGVCRAGTQLLVSRSADAMERKLPIYWASFGMRVVALAVVTSVLLFGPDLPRQAIFLSLLLCLALYTGGQGLAGLAWSDIIARSIPTTKRGSFIMWRRLIGLALVIAFSAPLVKYLLGPGGPARFPRNYGYLFLVNLILAAIAWGCFSLVREPTPHAARHKLTLGQHLVRGARLWRRDRHYRRLLRVRAVIGLAAAIAPFFVVFGSTRLGLDDWWAGVFITIQVVTEWGAIVLMGRLSDVAGNRRVVIVTACLSVAATAIVLAAALLAGNILWGTALLCTAFAVLGALSAGRQTGEFNYLLDIAPARKRSSYIGFSSTVLMPVLAAPLLVGALVPRLGYIVVFAAAAVLAVAAVWLSTRLEEPREELQD